MRRTARWTGTLPAAPLLLLFLGGSAPPTAPASSSCPPPHALTCREVEGLAPLLAPGSGLLLGEIHGTFEIPSFVANAACLALKAGRPVTVALEAPKAPAERDRWMGEALAEALDETRDGVVIALAGNLHVRVTRGTPFDPGYETSGFVLVSRRPDRRVTSLDVAYQPKSHAWFCTSAEPASCQSRMVHGPPETGTDRVVLYTEVKDGYNGVYEMGTLSSSPPARFVVDR